MQNLKTYLTSNNVFIVLLVVPILAIIILLSMEDSEKFTHLGTAVYASNSKKACTPNSRDGETGTIYGEKTLEGVLYNVRTPVNYNNRVAHPLLVVYAPANANRAKTEKMTNLTYQATSAGFIIAYVDHPELSTSTTVQLGEVPKLIAKKWCIDEERIYLTGHSDGGTVSMALAFMNGTRDIPTAIAPSAAGVTYQDLKEHKCPEPISVMVMHSKNDRLFSGYGAETVGWWAACNGCSPIPKQLDNGCISYGSCDNGVKTWYCEGDKTHSKWPEMNETMLKFLASSKRTRK